MHLYIHTHRHTHIHAPIYTSIYVYKYTNLPVSDIVRLPHPRSGDSQGQETFIAPVFA